MNKNESLITLQDALIIGCDFKIGHDAIAPYTYGYYVTSKYVKKDFCAMLHQQNSSIWCIILNIAIYIYLRTVFLN